MSSDELAAFERGQAGFAQRAQDSTARGCITFERLPTLAGTRDGGQMKTVVRLLAGLSYGETFPIDPYELRDLDVASSDDVLICVDVLRWGKQDLHILVPHAKRRTVDVLERRKFE